MVRGSMMPVASVPGVPAQRPKVAFSIDSLVGDSADKAGTPSPQPPPTELRQPSATQPAACSPPRRDTRSPVVSSARSPPAVASDPVTPDVLQQRLAHENERALHERLWRAHGLAGGLPALAAFGAASPLVRLPLADPRYTLKLAQLRGELLRPPGLLPPPQPPPAPSEMPLYPWLMSRHGRVFPGRYAPGPHLPEFLFQPFRKPKRIRTAFSPSQLLKLEHAFENNHYVVGQERKQLAQSLSLSETQVKVWFQNRRTKHKRAAPEGEAGEGSAAAGAGSQEGGDGSDDSETEDAAGAGIDVTN